MIETLSIARAETMTTLRAPSERAHEPPRASALRRLLARLRPKPRASASRTEGCAC